MAEHPVTAPLYHDYDNLLETITKGCSMAYNSRWERLHDALTRVMQANGFSQNKARAEICSAIADGAVSFRAKLGTKMGGGTSYDTTLNGDCFRVPTGLKPGDLNWRVSRPLKAWLVPRGAVRSFGHWNLEWIELSRADVTNVLCAPSESGDPIQPRESDIGAKNRTRPKFESARRAIQALYPNGVPPQVQVPNKPLCGRVAEWLESSGFPDVSDETILRAALRRK